jgi:hypothetical protein
MASQGEVLRWRGRISDTIAAVAHRLKETYGSAYYVPERHDSPWQSVKLAHEVADRVISTGQGETWDEFCRAVCDALQAERQGFSADDLADPDGYVCATFAEFIAALNPSGPMMTQGPQQGLPLGVNIALAVLMIAPLLAVIQAVFVG